MTGDERSAEDVQPAALQERADRLQVRVSGSEFRVPDPAYRRLLRLEGVLAGARGGKHLPRVTHPLEFVDAGGRAGWSCAHRVLVGSETTDVR